MTNKQIETTNKEMSIVLYGIRVFKAKLIGLNGFLFVDLLKDKAMQINATSKMQ